MRAGQIDSIARAMETEQLETLANTASTPLQTNEPEQQFNPRSGVPYFTPETAAEKGRIGGIKSGLAKKARREALAIAIALAPKPAKPIINTTEFEARKQSASDDLDKLQKMIDDCEQPDLLLKLLAAKATIWKLLFPTPKGGKQRRDFTPAEPIE